MCSYDDTNITSGGSSKLDSLNKKQITLADFEFGHYDYEPLHIDGEEVLINDWKGKAPLVVAKRMVAEYFRRFPNPVSPIATATDGPITLASAWHNLIIVTSRDWEGLDRSLKKAARLCYGQKGHFEYWERMCGIYRLLPNMSSRRIQRKFSKSATLPPFERMGICRLCWRAVPQNLDGSFAYCDIRNDIDFGEKYKANHNRKKRLTDAKTIRPSSLLYFTEEYNYLLSICNPGATETVFKYLSSESRTVIFDLSLDHIWNSNPEIIIRRLPYVYKYLSSTGTDLSSAKKIVTALEMPIPKDKLISTRKLRAKFYRMARRCYYDYFDHLIWAEIWLRYEAKQVGRGGARKGAGRPRKVNNGISQDKQDNKRQEHTELG